jgi:hypothetical protein
MNELSTPDSPQIIPESIIVHDEGELKKGLYYYVITAVGEKESIPSHILQVYAPNIGGNSIEFEWNKIPGVTECRIYRGTTLGHYDGYFSTGGEWFCDNGLGILNEDVCNLSH